MRYCLPNLGLFEGVPSKVRVSTAGNCSGQGCPASFSRSDGFQEGAPTLGLAKRRICRERPSPSGECLQVSLSPPENKRVHVVSSLVCVDGFEVLRVPHHLVFGLDPVSAMHVPRRAGDF